MPAGRPLKFETVEILSERIKEYFDLCEAKNRPLTITGLAVHLGTTRDTLLDYEGREEFSDTLKEAKEKIHNWTEEYLFTGKNKIMKRNPLTIYWNKKHDKLRATWLLIGALIIMVIWIISLTQ